MNCNVKFLVREWISVEIKKAASPEDAIKQATEIVAKSPFRDKRIEIIDGNEEYQGIDLNDVLKNLDS